MKKTLIINKNSEKYQQLNNKFNQYFSDDKINSVATLGEIEYEFLCVLNEVKYKDLQKFFTKHDGSFYVDCDNFSDKDLQDIYYAFNYATYEYSLKTSKEKSEKRIEFSKSTKVIKETKIICGAINNSRKLIDMPSNYLGTEELTKYMVDFATKNSLDFEILNKKYLEKIKAGGILAVNKGSVDEARVVKISYNGAGKKQPIVLIGKGIVYDSGGYSLKPGPGMVSMHTDMGGASTVISVLEACVKLKLKVNITLYVPITDNLIGKDAYRPGDIITMLNGKTVEIKSTDAEGRMLLADVLSYCQKDNPSLVIDVATLTGAVVNALGTDTTGLFGNNDQLISELYNAYLSSNEFSWQLPIFESHIEAIKGVHADIKNAASPAGASTAGAFLQEFIGDYEWIHIDIASTCTNKEDTKSTGRNVLPLIEFIKAR